MEAPIKSIPPMIDATDLKAVLAHIDRVFDSIPTKPRTAGPMTKRPKPRMRDNSYRRYGA